ncbi:hypothetical protein [Desulfoluna spongiiphila]|uniref:hypothetical protein n=1 Tax=Desulfoluna spongiiphila TaxID=419481 RepID=UPI001114050F|nr:hypothetical protein [Desulfoluna spongiiphila]
MKRGTQTNIVNKTKLSAGFVSEIFSGKKRPSWKKAKVLAGATGTEPIVWLEGTPEEIKAAIKKAATQPDPLP